MSLIDKEVSDFKVKAYHNEEIIDVELKDVKGKWSIFSSIQQILHLYVQQN